MKFLGRREHVAVLGAGYAGLSCAVELARGGRTSVTLVNREARQELSCELFRALRSGEAEYFDFRDLLRKNEIRFIEAQVSAIDPFSKKIELKGASVNQLSYDSLVIATGTKARVPQIEGLPQENVFFFRKNADAQALRMALRRLGWQRETPLNGSTERFVVIVGAGSSGIEVAAEIAAMRGKNRRARVVLVDEKSTLLSDFSPIAQKILKKELVRMQIESILGSPATKVFDRELHIQNGQVIPWDLLVLCTGGQVDSALLSVFGSSLDPQKGLLVDGSCTIEKFPGHFAIGDVARIPLGSGPLHNRSDVENRAQFAVQAGIFVARQISRRLRQNGFHAEKENFKPHDFAHLLSLGPYNGIARLGGVPRSRVLQLLSPFVMGPIVEELKRAAKIKYLASLRSKLISRIEAFTQSASKNFT